MALGTQGCKGIQETGKPCVSVNGETIEENTERFMDRKEFRGDGTNEGKLSGRGKCVNEKGTICLVRKSSFPSSVRTIGEEEGQQPKTEPRKKRRARKTEQGGEKRREVRPASGKGIKKNEE